MNRRLMRPAFAVGLVLLLFVPVFSAEKNKDLKKHYGLIFGTVYDPGDRPLYGAKIEIHPVATKQPAWELSSDHRGEFAQRVPPGPADYLVSGEAEAWVVESGARTRRKIKGDAKVHIQGEERKDVALHLK